MKAYKVFNPDWTCRNFQYEIGKTYELKENGQLIKPIKCHRGFHACLKVNQCFNYYDFNPNNKIAIVELSGDIIEDNDKLVSNVITIIEEISWEQMLVLTNTGDGNSGYSNSGNRNSGNRNSGDSNSGNRNSGDWNSGNWNSGDWNSCNKETGFFNSISPKTINVFNKPLDIKIWNSCIKPNFIYNVVLNQWINFSDMTDQEKIDFPKAFVCDGYLKTFTYKEAWQNAYNTATEKDIKLLKALPNFDADVFKEITGIKID